MPPFTISRVMVLIAVICFILAFFGVHPTIGSLTDLGLFFWCASILIPNG
jgi:hypothetical protein